MFLGVQVDLKFPLMLLYIGGLRYFLDIIFQLIKISKNKFCFSSLMCHSHEHFHLLVLLNSLCAKLQTDCSLNSFPCNMAHLMASVVMPQNIDQL